MKPHIKKVYCELGEWAWFCQAKRDPRKFFAFGSTPESAYAIWREIVEANTGARL